MNNKIKYKSSNNIVYSSKYHIVWCPKYRRKVLVGDVEKRLKEIIEEVAKELKVEIIEMETDIDNIHILGDVYICMSLEQEKKKSNRSTGNSVGIDFGLKKFLTLSDKQSIDSPLFHLQNLSEIKKLNRNLSQKRKGSNRRKKAKRRLAKLHIKVANQRKDYFHKLSNELVKKYETIFIEDLNMRAMKRLWGRKVSDLAFSEFVKILEYKTVVIKIDRFYPSSKTCSGCGTVKDNLDLKTRVYKCESCNLVIDRDYNASINIHRVGASTLK